jgi:hypothetical protein
LVIAALTPAIQLAERLGGGPTRRHRSRRSLRPVMKKKGVGDVAKRLLLMYRLRLISPKPPPK